MSKVGCIVYNVVFYVIFGQVLIQQVKLKINIVFEPSNMKCTYMRLVGNSAFL
jgi:hypothetical protein